MWQVLESIENSGFATWVRETPSVLGYSTVLAFHTFGMAFLVGLSGAIALRVLGVLLELPLKPLERFFPLIVIGFWVNAVTGAVLATLTARSLAVNVDFYIKLIAIVFAIVGLRRLKHYAFDDGAAPAVTRARGTEVVGRAERGLPMAAARRLLPWGVFGFAVCVVTGLMFVTGMRANIPSHPYDVIRADPWLQLKLVFIGLAGLNLLAFYVTGMSRAVHDLRAGDDAPPLAKMIAGASLFLWLGVIYFGRLIPEGL